MCELYKRIEDLCASRRVSVSEMCRATEIPRANLTELKQGRQKSLRAEAIAKIAAYFGVSSDFLLTGTENNAVPERERSGAADKVYFALFHGGEEITDEQYEEVLSFVDYVKAKNRKKE